MATAPPSPNDLTRQQLDELDALLQRMLSLPLAPPETPRPAVTPPPAAPLPPIWRHDPQPAPAAPAAPPTPADPPSAVSLLAEAMKQAPPQPAPAAVPVSKPAPPPPAKPQAAKPVPAPAPALVPAQKPRPAVQLPESAPAAPAVPVLFLPFVLLNSLFDAVCGLLGPPGQVLRSPALKHLYGLAGIGLLLYTAARVAQVQGWVSLPVALPWPS